MEMKLPALQGLRTTLRGKPKGRALQSAVNEQGQQIRVSQAQRRE